MVGGTCTTGRPGVGGPGRGRGFGRGRVPGVGRGFSTLGGLLDRVGPFGASPDFDDEPLHAGASAISRSAIAEARWKGLQAGCHPVDSMAMEATQLYPAVPDSSRRPDLEARVAELERVVATLATLRDARLVDRPRERSVADLDPVALTRALHSHGGRTRRRSPRRSSGDGTLALRVVLFDPPRR